MKKLVFLLATLVVCSTAVDAQFFKNVLNSAKQTAERAVEKQVDKKVEQGVEKIFNPKTGKYEPVQQQQQPQQQQESGWICLKCGKMGNTGKFCSDCGAKRPENGDGTKWTCPECGHAGNDGKFCAECGAKRPEAEPVAPAPTPAPVPAPAPEVVVPAAQPVQVELPDADADMRAQIAAWQALGCLTPEEIAHLQRIAAVLEPMTDEQAGMYLMSNAEEFSFLMSIQMKVYAAMTQGKLPQ